MANLLDDLFQWAAQQPAGNITHVNLAMTGNEIGRNNLVSYAEGTLSYTPAHHVGMFFLPATFHSAANGITQYFSDRRIAPVAPFDPDSTDPLTITITYSPPITPVYALTVHSSKWGFDFTVNPIFDPATEIIYATNGLTFLTFSLCGRFSQPVPR